MNPVLIIQTLYLFFFCLVMAVLEIQIEGKYGWASRLPTWRADNFKWYSRIYRKLVAEKELTAYHLLVFTLVLIFLHYPYLVGRAWSWSSELTTLSFFFLVCVIWDFLWFVINPDLAFPVLRQNISGGTKNGF